MAVLGVGSCVVVVLHDDRARLGGLAHILLPDPRESIRPEKRSLFARTAVPDLIEELLAAGAEPGRLRARLVGGSCMFRDLHPADRASIGARNVAAVRAVLSSKGIPVVAEDVGGEHGRSLEFRVEDGRVRISAHGRSDAYI